MSTSQASVVGQDVELKCASPSGTTMTTTMTTIKTSSLTRNANSEPWSELLRALERAWPSVTAAIDGRTMLEREMAALLGPGW
jgi:hypothetical protein